MLNQLLFTLFLTQVGTVAAITACIVGTMCLFYAEIIALDKYDPKKPLEATAAPRDECGQWIHPSSLLSTLQAILSGLYPKRFISSDSSLVFPSSICVISRDLNRMSILS